MIIGQYPDTKTIRLFTRARDDRFEIRDVRYDGTVARVVSVPCFARSYLDTYALDMMGLAVSPDTTRVAYYEGSSQALRLFDINSQVHRTLLPDVASKLFSVKAVVWCSNTELLVCVYEWEQHRARGVLLDVETGALRCEFVPVSLRGSCEVSPDGRYVVCHEAAHVGAFDWVQRIYNLELCRLVATITAADGGLYGGGKWTATSDAVFYAQGNRLMLYTLASGESQCLRVFEEDTMVHLMSTSGRRVFFVSERKRMARSIHGVQMYDLDSRRELLIDGVKNNGEVLASPDGKYLISGWGL